MAAHHLKSSVETVHWGLFDAALEPVLSIASGDQVTIETVTGAPENLPGPGYHVPPELYDIHDGVKRRTPGHLLTGPIAVEGAVPGDVLEIKILDIALRQDWGYTLIRPLAGTLPGEFEQIEQIIVALDAETGLGRLPWGTEIKLRPFFGVMGVAPPAGWGPISTIEPRLHGGNLDNKELVAGTSLFLPVQVPGALFSTGDGHGVQGDGEVCVTAIETALKGTFEFHLHKNLGWNYPRAETADHLISMGMNASLDQAAKDAVRRMVDWIVERSDLSRTQAYMLCSLAADVRVTQLVNIEKGCHVMLDKSLI